MKRSDITSRDLRSRKCVCVSGQRLHKEDKNMMLRLIFYDNGLQNDVHISDQVHFVNRITSRVTLPGIFQAGQATTPDHDGGRVEKHLDGVHRVRLEVTLDHEGIHVGE
jgi:hypothetical protein